MTEPTPRSAPETTPAPAPQPAPQLAPQPPGPFDPGALRDRLARFPAALRAAVAIVDDSDARWKPAPEHWSVLEICAHLHDEEHEDFRPRAELTLRDPSLEWPRLDLKDVATLRRYNEKDLATVLDGFVAARAANIAWLDSVIDDADWSRARIHPTYGPLAAGMLLASWAAHDALHLRQIAKRLHDLATRDAGTYTVIYAGEW